MQKRRASGNDLRLFLDDLDVRPQLHDVGDGLGDDLAGVRRVVRHGADRPAGPLPRPLWGRPAPGPLRPLPTRPRPMGVALAAAGSSPQTAEALAPVGWVRGAMTASAS